MRYRLVAVPFGFQPRNETVGGYDVRSGKVFGFVADRRGVEVFLCLLDPIHECHPTDNGHIVCDNPPYHRHEDVVARFEKHPGWTQGFPPTHASWLNPIECAVSFLQSQVIARGSFRSTQKLRERM